jgi:AraC family transcriptional regulator
MVNNVMTVTVYNRMTRLLNFIHNNLDQPLLLDDIASAVHSSRWQIQRDFSQATGLSVAHYVRSLKLSKAATQLVEKADRQLDIVIQCGFESEISFHRSFKRHFGCTPGQYRKRNKKTEIQLPIDEHTLIPLRIETKNTFCLTGLSNVMNGVLSPVVTVTEKVPSLWGKFLDLYKYLDCSQGCVQDEMFMGVIDTREASGLITYWAGVCSSQPVLEPLVKAGCLNIEVPRQNYLVISNSSIGLSLAEAVKWILNTWLPESEYTALQGFDLEVKSSNGLIEYWIPVVEN